MIMRCETQDQPKAVRMSVPDDVLLVDPLAELTAFRRELLGCFTRRRDALFELADAMLCAQGRVCSPAELSLEPESRRGYGSAYAALGRGRIDDVALRRLLVGRLAAARPGQPLMFAIDTTPLARPGRGLRRQPNHGASPRQGRRRVPARLVLQHSGRHRLGHLILGRPGRGPSPVTH